MKEIKISHSSDRLTCIIQCQGRKELAKERFEYLGPPDCWLNFLLFGGTRDCPYGCLGYGNCAAVCPNKAIKIEDQFPVIDSNRCDGCGICIKECPKGILKLIPCSQLVYPACSLVLNKKVEICKAGCNGCGICIESCPLRAIAIKGNSIEIDFERCNSCGICVHKCSQNVFVDRARARPYAVISLKCNGCGECLKVCQFGAIKGELNKRHIVDNKKCIGCGKCFEVCKIGAITMAGALGYADAA
uniref:4Fe-4S dicluster domain-containing protein n=1 Tax=candidate division WOR-3 bacterium TaxID=2052148 RepID=A0A7C4XC00_UNCW3